jgi:hypothetical protein
MMKTVLVLAGIGLAIAATGTTAAFAKNKSPAPQSDMSKMINDFGASNHAAAPIMEQMFDELESDAAEAAPCATAAPMPAPPYVWMFDFGTPAPTAAPCSEAAETEPTAEPKANPAKQTVTKSGPKSHRNTVVWSRTNRSDKLMVKQRGGGNSFRVQQSD